MSRKFRVYTEPKPSDEVFFRLEEYRGGIQLRAYDSVGNFIKAGNILSIQANGKLLLHNCISKKIGLQLDKFGCIELM